jgi:hypothetical protein
MDRLSTLLEIEEHYRSVLALAEEQLRCLQTGQLTTLPGLLQKKADRLEQAGLLTASLRSETQPSPDPALQEILSRVQEILAKLVGVEDQCERLLPHAPKTAPVAARHAAQQYSRQR